MQIVGFPMGRLICQYFLGNMNIKGESYDFGSGVGVFVNAVGESLNLTLSDFDLFVQGHTL